MTREQALVAAAEKFIAKVEREMACSLETYAELKAALAIPSMGPRPKECSADEDARLRRIWEGV